MLPSDEDITSYVCAWNELYYNGAVVEDCHVGGYNDLVRERGDEGEAGA